MLIFQLPGIGYSGEDPAKPAHELETCLSGAARYCRTLSSKAFHFVCHERVINTVKKLNLKDGYNVFRTTPRTTYWNINQLTQRFMFDYQLIFKQGRVHEKRKLLSGDSNALEREFVWGLIVSYLNERAVFGPQTLLSEERQKRFVFDFKRISDVDTHALMEIQFTPREGGSEFFDSGTVWVDCRDFSVRRIRVIPRYIRGYEKLQRQAERYKVRLVLTCEIYYDRFYEDVYFPSRVIISESYQGGPVLGGTVGAKGFERSKTTYQYDRYRFFKINTRVKVE